MTHPDATSDASDDRFYAQFDSREVELMTLDELQAAFEAGRIHENTYVCREGESEWLTLADVAGIGGDDAADDAVESVPASSARAPSLASAASAAAATSAAATNAPPVGRMSRPPMPNRPVVDLQASAADQRPSMPAGAVAGASASRPPMSNRAPAAVDAPPFVPSLAPVTSTVSTAPNAASPSVPVTSVDSDELGLRPKRRWGRVLLAAAVLTAGGGVAAFALNGNSPRAIASGGPNATALEVPASKSEDSRPSTGVATELAAVPSAPAAVSSAAVKSPADSASSPTSGARPGLSDDVKEALLNADKARQNKHAAKTKAKANYAAGAHRKTGTSSGLKSSGNAYDPLNGKL